ncbi:unnamed protein product [Amoebophrya sp. A120]|nr:unnamed protein product [Amoebophrya sp. A120]|eukprot:GSA120T00014885001.1
MLGRRAARCSHDRWKKADVAPQWRKLGRPFLGRLALQQWGIDTALRPALAPTPAVLSQSSVPQGPLDVVVTSKRRAPPWVRKTAG